jgi:hypothetical protein
MPGGGCGIYETRFPICQTWHCAWRVMEELPEAARPDRSGVIFSLVPERKTAEPFKKHFIMAVGRSLADFDNPAVMASLNILAERGTIPIWVHVGDTEAMVYPDAALADAICHPTTTPHHHLLAKAADLRRQWRVEIDL